MKDNKNETILQGKLYRILNRMLVCIVLNYALENIDLWEIKKLRSSFLF